MLVGFGVDRNMYTGRRTRQRPFDDGTSANAPAGDHLAEIAEAAADNEKGDNPDAELSEEDQNNFENKNKGQKRSTPAPSSPTGPPPRLTDRQRARLHQFLQERDDQGNVPFGLDAYDTDEEKRHAYRRASETTYRANRKEQRHQGSWTKDQPRWTRRRARETQ